jgi:hypothetical protein
MLTDNFLRNAVHHAVHHAHSLRSLMHMQRYGKPTDRDRRRWWPRLKDIQARDYRRYTFIPLSLSSRASFAKRSNRRECRLRARTKYEICI